MIVGVDVSTFAVHTAWLEDNNPQRWHIELGTTKDEAIDRIRNVRMQWPEPVTEIAIEYPYGPNRDTHGKLMAIVGAVTKSAPTYCRVAWISSQDLRKAILAKNTKQDALDVLLGIAALNDWHNVPTWTEHECDALVACLGWTQILKAQDA